MMQSNKTNTTVIITSTDTKKHRSTYHRGGRFCQKWFTPDKNQCGRNRFFCHTELCYVYFECTKQMQNNTILLFFLILVCRQLLCHKGSINTNG